MISKSWIWAMGACVPLLVVAVPTASQAAEPSARHAPAADSKIVCRWGKRPGAQTKEKFCGTVAQWRAIGVPVPTRFYPSTWGPSPSVPGNSGFGTVASQSSFQR